MIEMLWAILSFVFGFLWALYLYSEKDTKARMIQYDEDKQAYIIFYDKRKQEVTIAHNMTSIPKLYSVDGTLIQYESTIKHMVRNNIKEYLL